MLDAINRTHFGIETTLSSFSSVQFSVINRTHFGIETLIAGSPNVNPTLINRTHFGIETFTFQVCKSFHFDELIVPILELKQNYRRASRSCFYN